MDGVDVIDTWLLVEHHGLFYKNRFNFGIDDISSESTCNLSTKRFSGILAQQIIDYRDQVAPLLFEPVLGRIVEESVISEMTGRSSEFRQGAPAEQQITQGLTDRKGDVHNMVMLPKKTNKKGKMYRKQRECQKCGYAEGKRRLTSALCGYCDKPYCIPSFSNGMRNCFEEHVKHGGPYRKEASPSSPQEPELRRACPPSPQDPELRRPPSPHEILVSDPRRRGSSKSRKLRRSKRRRTR